jgi:hypothetical protein
MMKTVMIVFCCAMSARVCKADKVEKLLLVRREQKEQQRALKKPSFQQAL